MSKPKTVFIVAGEASGDLHAANLSKELVKLDASIKLEGMGGKNMRAAGVNILFDATDLAVMGIVEVLAKYRMIKGVLNQIKQHITNTKPDLLVLVDYQEFNQRLAAYAKQNGIKVLFYIGPQVWAWRPKRVFKMAKIVDQMAVIFPFEVDLYKKARVPVSFTGHPLIDEVIADKSRQQAQESLGLKDQTTIGLFPGSRINEIERLLPILIKTAKLLKQAKPEIQFVLPLASTIQNNDLIKYEPALSELNVNIIEDKTYDVMQACDAIVVASGTATLEIGLMGIPMVIIYKLSPLSYLILRWLVKIKHVGLVNIVPEKEIIKEFIQNDAQPVKIADEILHILDDNDYNKTMRNELSELRRLLGNAGCSKNVASLAFNMLQHDG